MMDSLTIFIIVVLIHCTLFFFDTFFKSCSHNPYLYFLENTGLQVEAFKVRWFTTAFNRFFQKCGFWRPKLLDCWFTLGIRCSLALLPVAMYIVIRTALNAWLTGIGTGGTSSLVLEPLVPGVNLPVSDIGYYLATLITCSIVHELGHAVAAVREDVHIDGTGLIVVLIVPFMCVHLNTQQYDSLPPKRQLRITCAGVWHNFVLTIAAMSVLILLPVLLYPFFDIGTGVTVRNIQQASPLLGPSGLQTGDKVLALNQCQVKDYDTWYQCIQSAVNHASPGYCVSSDLVKEHDESIAEQLPGGAIECCSAKSSDHLCFEYLDKEENMPELPPHTCLPGRVVIESTDEICVTASDCSVGLHCLKPSLDNHTRLLYIKRANAKMVIFLGHPSEVYHTVRVSDFVPVYSIIPPAIPEVIMQMCKYLSVFSAGLAIINIIPCFYFDGQYIIQAICNILLAHKVKHKSVRNAIAVFITVCGTIFIFGNLLSITLFAIF
ncbi:membrane-bound transcription factor site-2 protease isoform X2 [Cryptotermes secundus]|uniref:membrane-bound transcription factor site-2 protease isoform X2 n=1 Tax=Cryptotermes secundus TaxID=105785 RepID=UPI000CD7B419|nr:membrane-bound transcription factor site-2 protease isoform X2 [Cryptotermes secundus]